MTENSGQCLVDRQPAEDLLCTYSEPTSCSEVTLASLHGLRPQILVLKGRGVFLTENISITSKNIRGKESLKQEIPHLVSRKIVSQMLVLKGQDAHTEGNQEAK